MSRKKSPAVMVEGVGLVSREWAERQIPPYHAPVEPGQTCPRCKALEALQAPGAAPWSDAETIQVLLEALLDEHTANWGDDGCPLEGKQDDRRCRVHELVQKVKARG